MNILGLNHGEYTSSAALVVDGRVVAGAAEERFNREKKSKEFPRNAVQYCLDFANLRLEEIDAVGQAWNPGAAWIKFNPLKSGTRLDREDNFYAIPDQLYRFSERDPKEWVKMSFPEDSPLPPIYHVQHHRAHSATAFYLSRFERAAILTADWRGEFETTTLGYGEENALEVFAAQNMPHSLGAFYAAYTELLGYRPDNDEWKVMALSAFDVDDSECYRKIRETVSLLDNGLFELDQTYYKPSDVAQPGIYTEHLVELLGGRTGEAGDRPDRWTKCVAKAMQRVAEEIALHLLSRLYRETRCPNVVVSGGFFMNSVFNGKLIERSEFERLYVPYAPGDNGNSMGAALYLAHDVFGEERAEGFNSSLIGPSYGEKEIEAVLERRKIPYEKLEEPAEDIARLLVEEGIVACFGGRMEFGDRALGNRSILADPREAEIKNRINSAIKYREAYRPFAPSTALEHVGTYFDVEEDFRCPYMEKVVPIREKYREKLGAVTHVDGSGRVQTVDREENPRFHAIIEAFRRETGIPIVLNTSFNVSGEPIVQSPDDALNTFYNSGLQCLVLGHRYLVRKG